jgi:phosphoribosylanthranilate isomerase
MIKIKICGLFREDDIEYANEAGPDFAGLVFAPSRRQVSPATAARLRSKLAPGIIPVGVFVRAPAEEIVRYYREGLFDIAQLHGDEDGDYIRRLKELSAGTGRGPVPVIRALRVESAADLAPWRGVSIGRGAGPNIGPGAEPAASAGPGDSIAPDISAGPDASIGPDAGSAEDYLLLDRGGGGTGRPFDWGLLGPGAGAGKAAGAFPVFRRPWFLAGGLSLDTVGRALAYRPFALDVSSGAETGGIKDREKMIALVKRTREESKQ